MEVPLQLDPSDSSLRRLMGHVGLREESLPTGPVMPGWFPCRLHCTFWETTFPGWRVDECVRLTRIVRLEMPLDSSPLRALAEVARHRSPVGEPLHPELDMLTGDAIDAVPSAVIHQKVTRIQVLMVGEDQALVGGTLRAGAQMPGPHSTLSDHA